jgi:hypothetical protein
MQVPAYAIDDQTAIKVTDGSVEVVSEGALEAVYPRRCMTPTGRRTRRPVGVT